MEQMVEYVMKGDERRKEMETKHPQKVFAALFAGVHDLCVYTHNQV